MSKNDQENPLAQNSNRDYEIPVEGSLGLLALGAKGIDLWRKKKAEANNHGDNAQIKPVAPDEKK